MKALLPPLLGCPPAVQGARRLTLSGIPSCPAEMGSSTLFQLPCSGDSRHELNSLSETHSCYLEGRRVEDNFSCCRWTQMRVSRGSRGRGCNVQSPGLSSQARRHSSISLSPNRLIQVVAAPSHPSAWSRGSSSHGASRLRCPELFLDTCSSSLYNTTKQLLPCLFFFN